VWHDPQSKLRESALSESRRAVLARIQKIADGHKNAAATSIQSPSPLIAQEPNLRDVLKGHSDVVFCVAFSPDGKILASASGDKTIKLWDVVAGKDIATLRDTHSVLSITFSLDGQTLASGSQGKTIKLWDVTTGKNTATLGRRIAWVNSVAFSPDGKTLASTGNMGGLSNTIEVWDVKSANPAGN
jgi:WD40 repeat protein